VGGAPINPVYIAHQLQEDAVAKHNTQACCQSEFNKVLQPHHPITTAEDAIACTLDDEAYAFVACHHLAACHLSCSKLPMILPVDSCYINFVCIKEWHVSAWLTN
jgi:hypothetical protein